ncbi:hypothetical protein GLOTRDRAFT_136571 [Gloeophyllum trabeum ATCC 11539]|uniref:Uncharacterized protein n=1 Tax=Gloeophyllum trabeum (strain ATCC 11539 / FP-39264 / Madison 617) TaxID=670483 RepID=S7QK90_GLOTA|nr:uncharacterized protein GLOTRDRAFT_136571 [Gloeophyllum trabeum ATCC 11539]EPQ59802.1 hypothetical protein GLOTRDRAFT_136571 [Gloeophyllum trabeum ATCC 11539]
MDPHNGEGSYENGSKPGSSVQDGQEIDVKQQTEMADSLKRSITLVIWYKPNESPIRLNHHVPSFPLFQMSHFPQLVSELNLNAESYVDAYNDRTGQWEQHMITTVRPVESEQRLLYKVRKSLFAGLSDEECVGLADELALQAKARDPQNPRPSPYTNKNGKAVKFQGAGGKKRAAPEEPSASAPPAAKYHITDYGAQQGYMLQHPGHAYPQNLSSPGSHLAGASPMGTHGHITHVAYPYQTSPTQYPPAPLMAMAPSFPPHYPHQAPQHHHHPAQAAGPGSPFHGHAPAVKRWPNDYTVAEVTLGFAQMDGLMSQTPSITQRVAFERVFGTRYVKSTVCRHRGVWKRAGKGVGSMGNGEREMWGDFVRRIEGRRGEIPKPVILPLGEGGSISGADRDAYNDGDGSGSADASGDQEEEEEDADAEAVMGSLGPPPPPLNNGDVQGVPAPIMAATSVAAA